MRTLPERKRPWPSTMDVAREGRSPGRSRALAGAGIVVGALLFAWALRSFLGARDAGPTVDRAVIVTAMVRRGPFERSIAAAGTLQPEQVHVVSAAQDGVVAYVAVKPGAVVSVGSVIARLENPDLNTALVAAQSQLAVARANLASARQEAGAAHLARESAFADAQSQMQQDAVTVRTDRSLVAQGLIGSLSYRIAKIRAAQSGRQAAIGQAQITVDAADSQAKIAAAQAQVDVAAAELAGKQTQVASLVVRSGAPGIVEAINVESGARVTAGTQVASVADRRNLKAVLEVPETQVHDVLAGMSARIDTGNGVALGRVARIAPAADQGSVAVDVAFMHGLPAGARPDANVDGTIELSRIADTLSVARPAGAVDGTTIPLFKLVDGGNRAVRERVRLGQGSAGRVQVLSGLAAGDRVIISDTSSYDDSSTLRIR